MPCVSIPTVAALPRVLLAGVVQPGPVDGVTTGSPLLDVIGGAIGVFLTTLLVGAIMIAIAPEYTTERMAALTDNPLSNFGYGLVSLLVLIVVTILLVVTIIGILLALPLALAAYVLWAVGSAIGFLAIADRLVTHEDGWTVPLLIAAGLNGLLALTGIGGVVSFCVGAAGFGAVVRALL